jgi:alkylation response protein AidB-like acyl-CoA dehydrogenase
MRRDKAAVNLTQSPAETAFREEVRSFFADTLTRESTSRTRAGLRPEPSEVIAYQKHLAARGWGAPTWPAEYGGPGWTPTQLYIFQQEAARADAPLQYQQGLELIGPIIFTYGTAAQKARYLPRIISADDWWCQGYSEPGAGSDLAALRTRAVRRAGYYVVDGQKTWTSFAHLATHMFTLVRTGSGDKKQSGISMLLIDMKTPGIRIRPLMTLDELHHTNEVFLDGVKVPVDDLVGEEGEGWTYGKVLLDRERGVAAASALRISRQLLAVREAARQRLIGAGSMLDDATFRVRLAQLEIETTGLEMTVLRLMTDSVTGIDSGTRASMLKIRWAELTQQAAELWTTALGYDAAAFDSLDGCRKFPRDMPHAMQGALYSRLTSIYGGASEIQRNIIARRSLGL